jgi:hypothetical protein
MDSDGQSGDDFDPRQTPGCGGCFLAVLVAGLSGAFGYADDHAQRTKPVYLVPSGKTFKIDILSDLQSAKGLTRISGLEAALELEALPKRQLDCRSLGDSDFSELETIETVSYKGVPLNSVNVDSTFKLSADIPDDPSLIDKSGELVFSGQVKYYVVEVEDRLASSVTGSVALTEKSYDLVDTVPVRVVPPGTTDTRARPFKTAAGISLWVALILGLISGVRFMVAAAREGEGDDESAPPADA